MTIEPSSNSENPLPNVDAGMENYNGGLDANEFLDNFSDLVSDSNSEDIFFPVSILSGNSSGLESISRYLKENGYKNCEIADMLNRDDRTTWGACKSSKEKSERLEHSDSSIKIPLSIFRDRKLSILESITEYLKEKCNFRFCGIARLLNKDPRTIWTVYSRAKRKRKNGQ